MSFAQAPTTLTWNSPASITYGTPLSGVQLDAVATSASTVAVPLSSYYNVDGIASSNTDVSNGGYDGQGSAYDSSLLGSSITWNGVSYTLGPADAPDAVSNETIPLPAGQFASLVMLGSAVNNYNSSNPTSTFIVKYTDGTTQKIVQGLSDWVYPQNYANESVAECNTERSQANVALQAFSVCVYAYQISLDSTKTVQSITLPATRNIVMLAMGLMAPTVPGTFAYSPGPGTQLTGGTNSLSVTFTPTDLSSYSIATTTVSLLVTPATPTITWPAPAAITYGTALGQAQLDATATATAGEVIVPLSSYYGVNAFSQDGVIFRVQGFDGVGHAYSANELGAAITSNGVEFPLGPPDVPDAVTSTTIDLPAGQFSSLLLLGSSAKSTAEQGQTFTVTYTTGAPTTALLSLSSWSQPSAFPGETVVATTNHLDEASGSTLAGTYDIYGYQISLDPTRTVQSITLPNNRDVVVFAMALSISSTSTNQVPGSFAYVPGMGSTTLPVGTDPLSAVFTPNDTNSYANATGSTSIVVNQLPLVVTANNETAAFGSPIPPYTYTITGFVNGDTQASAITGSASLTTTPATPTSVGTYPITATIGSLSSANYSFSTFVPGVLTIALQNSLVVSANSVSRVYGAANPTFTGSITGAQNGDKFTESFSTSATISSPSGQYAITPSVSGANLGNYVETVQNGTLTVTQAPVVTTVALSAPSVYFGSNVTITTTVVSTTTGTPTGTVSLLDNGSPLGSAVLVNGVATYSTTSLAAGTNVIVAVYSGDIDFSASSASATSGATTITVQPLDFTLQLTSAPTVEGTYGSSGQFTLQLTPIGGAYPGTVAFSTGGTGPIAATYTFSPATVAQNGGPTDVTLTIATKKLASMERPGMWRGRLSSVAFSLFLLPLLGLRYSRRTGSRLRRLVVYLLFVLLSAGALGTITGCGAGYFAYTYPITVIATSGGVQHSVSVSYQIMASPQ